MLRVEEMNVSNSHNIQIYSERNGHHIQIKNQSISQYRTVNKMIQFKIIIFFNLQLFKVESNLICINVKLKLKKKTLSPDTQ